MSGSLLEKLENAKGTFHWPTGTAGNEEQAIFNLAIDRAIEIVRQHEGEDGCQYPYVKIGKYIVAAYP